jgi:hypothetical protein
MDFRLYPPMRGGVRRALALLLGTFRWRSSLTGRLSTLLRRYEPHQGFPGTHDELSSFLRLIARANRLSSAIGLFSFEPTGSARPT